MSHAKSLSAVLVLTFALGAVLVPTETAVAGAADRFIARGDRLFAKRGSGERWVRQAMVLYEKALAVDSKNTEASWRFARGSDWIGIQLKDTEKSVRAYRLAIDLTKRAIAIDSKSVPIHFWLGVCLAKYGEAKGALDSLSLLEPIRKHMRVVMRLDETFAGAQRTLGWIEYKLPGVLGGSETKALELLNRAVEIERGHLLNHLCLAEIHRTRKDFARARKHLKFIIDAPYQADRKPENELEKVAAKEMLATIDAAEKKEKS